MLTSLTLALLTTAEGCFSVGAQYAKVDLDSYNRQSLQAEQQMLLFNIGLLRYNESPHFMMLSTVQQTRSVQASASFQWTHLWNSLLIPLNAFPGAVENNGAVTTNGTNTYTVGPFAASDNENPTLTLTPIQGQDFANRFESPLSDKLSYFLEDQRWFTPQSDFQETMSLFAESLYIQNGDNQCQTGGLYVNDRSPTKASYPTPPEPPNSFNISAVQERPHSQAKTHYYVAFHNCLKQILDKAGQQLTFTILDTTPHQTASISPSQSAAGDLASVLSQAMCGPKLTTPLFSTTLPEFQHG